jgi:hypothetical protein
MSAAVAFATVPDDAERFLDLLAPGEPVAFQTFDDRKRKPDPFAKWMHGTLAQHRATLADLNARGAGVFWMVNAGDGKGRSNRNVQRIRALFVDLDGAPLEPVQASPLQPHCIVESSPNRWHAYWRIADCPLADFTLLQKTLAARFNADASVNDLCRVLRLPGFLHRKGEPFESRIIECNERAPYTLAEFRAAFRFDKAEPLLMPRTLAQPGTPQRRRRTLDRIPEGERNTRLLSFAGGFVRQGFDARAVNDRLQRINAERCDPPLCASEVDDIAARSSGYGSDGFAMLPHALLDSTEWSALPPPAKVIVLTAFRRYNGTNNGNIALTWADFDGKPGFAQKHTFYRHRRKAIASGILQASEGGNTQTGRKPDLFRIAPRWIHPAGCKKGTLRQCRKSTPLYR